MVTVVSSSGHRTTLTRLRESIVRRGLTIFAEIDHAAAARGVGMELANEVVLVFGNPRAGTPLMHEDARVGIELPLRILVWDAEGETFVGYNDPRDLARAYTLSSATPKLEAMWSLLEALVSEAATDTDDP